MTTLRDVMLWFSSESPERMFLKGVHKRITLLERENRQMRQHIAMQQQMIRELRSRWKAKE